MEIRKKPLSSDVSGDHWSDDKPNVQSLSSELVPVIGTIEQPTVITINSPYGTGKTFFAERFYSDLIKDKHTAILVNAWRDDFVGDPLPHMIAEITEGLDKCEFITPKKMNELIKEGARVFASKLLPSVAKHAVRVSTGVDTDELTSAIGEGAGDISEQLARELIDGFDKKRNAIENFKANLASLKTKEDIKSQRVVIIDELDRCNPEYVIKFLDVLKHIFDVDGFVFVLMCDSSYIRECVASCYIGLEDKGGYLRKFIDWNISLPKPDSLTYADHLITSFELDGLLQEGMVEWFCDRSGVLDTIRYFSEVRALSLRDLDKVFTSINFLMRSASGRDETIIAPLITYVSLIKEMEQSKFYERLNNTASNDYGLKHGIDSDADYIGILETISKLANSNQLDHFQNYFRERTHVEFGQNQSSKQIKQRELMQKWYIRSNHLKTILGFQPNVSEQREPFLSLFDRYAQRLEMLSPREESV